MAILQSGFNVKGSCRLGSASSGDVTAIIGDRQRREFPRTPVAAVRMRQKRGPGPPWSRTRHGWGISVRRARPVRDAEACHG